MADIIFSCFEYGTNVIDDDEAISCDICERWQHKRCNTGITLRQYRRMVRQEIELPWSCDQCREHPAAGLDHTAAADEPAADEPAEPAADELADHAANGIQDNSFNVHGDIRERPHIQDEALPDPPPNRNVIPDGPVTYEVVEGATRKGGQMLLGSDGIHTLKTTARMKSKDEE